MAVSSSEKAVSSKAVTSSEKAVAFCPARFGGTWSWNREHAPFSPLPLDPRTLGSGMGWSAKDNLHTRYPAQWHQHDTPPSGPGTPLPRQLYCWSRFAKKGGEFSRKAVAFEEGERKAVAFEEEKESFTLSFDEVWAPSGTPVPLTGALTSFWAPSGTPGKLKADKLFRK